jgi:hypothetical protein
MAKNFFWFLDLMLLSKDIRLYKFVESTIDPPHHFLLDLIHVKEM